MKLDLESVANTPGAQWTHEFTVAVPKDDELHLLEPVRGKIRVTNTGRVLLVRGEAAAKVRLECARCAEPFALDASVPIEEEFSIRGPEGPVEGGEDTIDIEDPGESAFAKNMLDLSELIRQQVLVSLPLPPLCRPDCKGLCPECGKNLNEGPCGCGEGSSKSPFAVLESLLGGSGKTGPSSR